MRDIVRDVTYAHPRSQVWAALTDPTALSEWLMPNDFQPRKGHRFTFRTDPGPGFDGIVHCEVVAIEPPRRMVWTWRGGVIDTTVVFELEDLGGATRLLFRQSGFEGLSGFLTRAILSSGARTIYQTRLPNHLAGAGHIARPTLFERFRHWLLTKGPKT